MSGTHHPPLRRVLTWLLVLGPLAAVSGIFLGSQKAGTMCGSVFRADNTVATYYDAHGGTGAAAACSRSIAAAAVPTWTLIVLGIVLILAAMVIQSLGNDRPMSATGARFRWRRRRPPSHGAGGQGTVTAASGSSRKPQ
ncbi:hypothetical protein [Arthrobacter sp. PsM3]|uniref:hypothetical protein n=1 Tax=Arthrobacter sp. PsM3 TaxID=3030531 RepID=UPI00263AB4A8|nr:hypothetical protein [Arthrobacter sp. PsM3]MDN4646170.1 hypothetical protein [Arthrobacter sp. PsM3]